MDVQPTAFQEWIKLRVIAVTQAYSVYDVLIEHGVTLVDKFTDLQIPCPFPEHGPDNRPSARYYATKGGHFHCFKCHIHETTPINLHAKFKGLKFMEALQDLERRFRIRIPRKPEGTEFTEPVERGSDYISDQWSDIPRVLALLENKLKRLRDKVSLTDYVKFCRVIDAVQWDYDHGGNKPTPAMISILTKLRTMMQSTDISLE